MLVPFLFSHSGESEGVDTPEEARVVEESRLLVRLAQERLAEMDANVVALQVIISCARADKFFSFFNSNFYNCYHCPTNPYRKHIIAGVQ